MILTIRTDKPEAEVRLLDDHGRELSRHMWHAHRTLADTLLVTIKNQLDQQHKDFPDITGIVVFKGPGSFTGLRIGITIANTLGYALSVPIVGSTGDEWAQAGVQMLANNHNDTIVLPEYGAEANITLPKK